MEQLEKLSVGKSHPKFSFLDDNQSRERLRCLSRNLEQVGAELVSFLPGAGVITTHRVIAYGLHVRSLLGCNM